jgi:hypothetical protein
MPWVLPLCRIVGIGHVAVPIGIRLVVPTPVRVLVRVAKGRRATALLVTSAPGSTGGKRRAELGNNYADGEYGKKARKHVKSSSSWIPLIGGVIIEPKVVVDCATNTWE